MLTAFMERNVALKAFKDSHHNYQEEFGNDDTPEQMFTLVKAMKKELFDLSDTMDIMSQVIHRLDKRQAVMEQWMQRQSAMSPQFTDEADNQ